MNPSRRVVVMVALMALVVAGVVTDHVVGRPGVVAAAAAVPDLPAQAPDGALSSTWFCPATSAVDNGLADGRIVIANPATGDLTGTVTVIPSTGAPHDVPVRVPPRSRLSVRPGDVVKAPYAAALVQLDGSVGGVEQQIRGALGESATPCATRASDHWYFAAGSTDPDAQLLLSLFNPFPGDAIVDLNFATDTGPSTPSDLQGLVVPGPGVTVIDIGQHVRRRHAVSTTVTARTGRVVAAKVQLRGAGGSSPKGATIVLGAPLPGGQWFFPDGVAATGVDERYELYNPSAQEAEISVALLLDQGSADPFDLTVPAHDRLTLTVNGESRIPKGVAHSGVVSSVNGVPIIVERVIVATPPSTHQGISDLVGAPRASTHWLFVTGAANDVQDEWIVAFNPGTAPTRLSVTGLVSGQPLAVDGLQDVQIPPGQRVAMRLGDHLSQGNLIVTVDAQAPVVMERDLYRIGGIGMSASVGVPVTGS
jgi:hypothetical protein